MPTYGNVRSLSTATAAAAQDADQDAPEGRTVRTGTARLGRDLDPRLTFDSFVVGTANRLVASAARKVVESTARFYNPLLVHGPPGSGKTHLLNAIGHHARESYGPDEVFYDSFEHFMDGVLRSTGEERDALFAFLRDVRILLLDDVQFVIDRRTVQDEFGRVWDFVTSHAGQLVLASDRPPSDFDGLHKRLLSRLLGGLVLEVGQPDYETRLAILRQKAGERSATLDEGVPELLARCDFDNVRELQGALNRILAVQELEARLVTAGEVAEMLDLDVPATEVVAEVSGAPVAEVGAGDAAEEAHPHPAPDSVLLRELRDEGDGLEPAPAHTTPPPAAVVRAVDALVEPEDTVRDAWFLDREKIVWDWPDPRDWIAEVLD